jgi:hypothetical protein
LEPILTTLFTFGAVGAGAAGLRYLWRLASAEDARRETAALIAIEQSHAQAEAARAAAAAASQPRSVQYAPHFTYTTRVTPTRAGALPEAGAGGASAAQAGAAAPLPGVTDLASLGFTPTPQAILLALGPGGKLITVAARDLMHTALVGATGGGKSNTGRLILAQLLACGVDCVIADPHFAAYDADSGEDWRPIAARLKMAPARKADDIEFLLVWLHEEMTRRYARREQGQRPGKPVVAYVDELPSIVANVKGAMDTLGAILREGRKVGVYLVSASQDLLTSTLKTGGEIRENLRSCYYSGGAGSSVAPLLDMPRRDIGKYEAELGRGVVLLRCASTTEAQIARVPFASNGAVKALLGDGSGDMLEMPAAGTGDTHPGRGDTDAVPDGAGAGTEAGTGTDDTLIAALVARGLSANEIARIIGGTRGVVLAKVREAKAAAAVGAAVGAE